MFAKEQKNKIKQKLNTIKVDLRNYYGWGIGKIQEIALGELPSVG
jgi:hypothetical protein